MTDKATPTPSPAKTDICELLRSVPKDVILKIDTPNPLGVDTHSIPVGAMCHEAAAEVESLAAQSAPTGLTDMGWVIDAATKGELAAYDQGSAECQQAVTKILDGKDTGAGTANPPWEPLRRRLIALVAQAPVVQAGDMRSYLDFVLEPRHINGEVSAVEYEQALIELRLLRDRASSGAAQAVRMLTREELNDVALSEQVGWGPGEYVEAVQRKFAEVNGLRIPADGKIGDV